MGLFRDFFKGGGERLEWLDKVFCGSVDISRVCLPGLMVMLCGTVLVALAGRIAGRFNTRSPVLLKALIKVSGLIICAGGAMLAILG